MSSTEKDFKRGVSSKVSSRFLAVRRDLLAVTAALLMGASLVFTTNALAQKDNMRKSSPKRKSQKTDAAAKRDAGLKRLQFRRGQTNIQLYESIAKGAPNQYIVRAMKGQTMWIMIHAMDNPPTLEVRLRGDDRIEIPAEKSSSDEDASWKAVLPKSGDYIISVSLAQPTQPQYTFRMGFE